MRITLTKSAGDMGKGHARLTRQQVEDRRFDNGNGVPSEGTASLLPTSKSGTLLSSAARSRVDPRCKLIFMDYLMVTAGSDNNHFPDLVFRLDFTNW